MKRPPIKPSIICGALDPLDDSAIRAAAEALAHRCYSILSVLDEPLSSRRTIIASCLELRAAWSLYEKDFPS